MPLFYLGGALVALLGGAWGLHEARGLVDELQESGRDLGKAGGSLAQVAFAGVVIYAFSLVGTGHSKSRGRRGRY